MTTVKALQTIHSIDVAAFLRIVRWNTRSGLCMVARMVSASADGWCYLLIPVVISLYSVPLALQVFGVLAAGMAVERLCYYVLKNGFKRHRPPVAIPGITSVINASDEFSFPSGHTSAAFFIVTSLVLMFPGTWLVYFYLWASMVGLSRVVLGVHFPLDTVAGALLGSSIAWCVVGLIA